MMNDHNLDDLIIDSPEQKGGKAKGLLTIIALLIVVLIVAIILTKIILKDPNANNAILTETETEMISPELTLQDTPEEKNEDDTALSEMIKNEMTESPKEQKVQTTPEVTTKETVTIEEENTVSTPMPTPTPAETVKPVKKEIVKIPVAAPAAKPAVKIKPKPAPAKKAAQGQFFIQVGSFSKMPDSSSRLISVLKKQGYHYRIERINHMYKVLIGPYRNRPDVDRAIIRVKDRINKSAFVVKK